MRVYRVLFLVLTVSPFGLSQAAPAPTFPPGVESTAAGFMARVGPQTRIWIQQEASRELVTNTVSQAVATKAVRANPAFAHLGGSDAQAVAFLVLVEAARSAQQDLTTIADYVKRVNDQKATLRQIGEEVRNSTTNATAVQLTPLSRAEFDAQLARAKDNLDSLTEMGETESLRLQLAMDRLSKIMSILSNLSKQISATNTTITQNLK